MYHWSVSLILHQCCEFFLNSKLFIDRQMAVCDNFINSGSSIMVQLLVELLTLWIVHEIYSWKRLELSLNFEQLNIKFAKICDDFSYFIMNILLCSISTCNFSRQAVSCRRAEFGKNLLAAVNRFTLPLVTHLPYPVCKVCDYKWSNSCFLYEQLLPSSANDSLCMHKI